MRRILALAAAATALALPGVAFADWSWTRWSMPVKDVVAASGGVVSPFNGADNQRVHGWDLRAKGPVSQDGFSFEGEFYFDARDDALQVVRLTLKDPGQCAALEALLTSRHGVPVNKSRDLGALKSRVLVWNDDGKGNFLGLTGLNAVGDLPPLCFIRYRPRDPVDGG